MSRPMGMHIRQTIVTVPAATDTLLVAANPFRRYLAIANIGLSRATLGFDQAAVADSGFPLSASVTVGDQGGEMVWESGSVPLNSIHVISTVGTTVVVLEGS